MSCLQRLFLVVLAALSCVHGNMYDVVFPKYLPPESCSGGCIDWSKAASLKQSNVTQAIVNAWWFNQTELASAANYCAIPGAATGPATGDIWTSFAGPFCLCAPAANGAGGGVQGMCTAPLNTPEQINLQLATRDVVVAAFVTYHGPDDAPAPLDVPVAMLGTSSDESAMIPISGIFHAYREPLAPSTKETGRNYTMSFVRFGGLEPRTQYYYKVKGPGSNDQWSDVFSFRSLYGANDDGETKIGIFGDVAVARYNNFANLESDCDEGRIDAIVVMGDHAYDLGGEDNHRGDAYMNAFARTLSKCPWIPVVGNHEALDGDHFNRYRNQTWGEEMGQVNGTQSTATSALGHLLSKGLYLSPGSHGAQPSKSSRYFSVDVGLIHVVALDLNNISLAGQLEWLAKDLVAADANRAAVPWIVVTSHFPIYLASDAGNDKQATSSAKWWASGDDEVFIADEEATWRTCSGNGEDDGCTTVEDFVNEAKGALEPLFIRYKVDMYDAGHSHLYGVSWPMVNGTATQHNYVNPKGTIYITEGNGGVPGVPATYEQHNASSPFMRLGAKGGAYGRMLTKNATVLTYEHVWNNGNDGRTGEVMDTWSIVRTN